MGSGVTGEKVKYSCCRWCKLLSGGASAALRRKPEVEVDGELTTSPQCTLTTPCHYTERTPIAHVHEKVTTWSGQPLYSEFFELRPNSTLPLSSSPLHRCRLESAAEQPLSPAAAGDPVRPETRLLHRADCVYGHVPGGRGSFAATMAAATARDKCRRHDRALSSRRAVSTDRLLAGKDVAAEVVASEGNAGGGAASPDILPGSDLESFVNATAQ